MWISYIGGVGTPNPDVVQGSTVFLKALYLSYPYLK